jgi:hypothetical protein
MDSYRVPRLMEFVWLNSGPGPLQLSPPAKLGGEGDQVPRSELFVQLTAKNGAAARFYFSTTNETSAPVPPTVVVAPGAAVTNVYPLSDFYLWGPCGPVMDGSFPELLKPGAETLRMRVGWIPAHAGRSSNEVSAVESEILVQRPTWLFKLP